MALVPLTAMTVSVSGTIDASTLTTAPTPTTDSSNELIKSMKVMSIKGKEIEKLKYQ